MSDTVKPPNRQPAARRVKEVADRTHRRPEDILDRMAGPAAADLFVEVLSDDEILDLCDLQPGL
ncbi:MAG: hypothetical protein U0641_12560 [Anaerolineae bacterium]